MVAGHHEGGEDICISFAEERFFFRFLSERKRVDKVIDGPEIAELSQCGLFSESC